MQLFSPLGHQQVSDHLHALRQEAAQARLRSGQPSLYFRLKRLFVHTSEPASEPLRQPDIRIT
jgi:hypothetical protein